MLAFIRVVVLVLAVVLAALAARTVQLSWTSDQRAFSKGTDQLPDGVYAGSVAAPKNSWLGKKFDLAEGTGINLFSTTNASTTEKYPFVFSIGRGAYDPIPVIRIDYDLPANPFWLRPILDEIVEVAPGEYLGKMQLRLLPGYPFTLIFFKLFSRS